MRIWLLLVWRVAPPPKRLHFLVGERAGEGGGRGDRMSGSLHYMDATKKAFV